MKTPIELAEEINELAKCGKLIVFISKTAHLVSASGATVNGNALQITVDESPGAILGASAKGHSKTMSKAAKLQRRKAGFKKGNTVASHFGN